MLRLGTTYPGTVVHQYVTNQGGRLMMRTLAYEIMPDQSFVELMRNLPSVLSWTELLGKRGSSSQPVRERGAIYAAG